MQSQETIVSSPILILFSQKYLEAPNLEASPKIKVPLLYIKKPLYICTPFPKITLPVLYHLPSLKEACIGPKPIITLPHS